MARHFDGFSDDEEFDFEIRSVIGHAASGASDPGEVLAATSGLRRHDHEAWFGAWYGLAERTAATAKSCAAAGHRVSAAAAHLRASGYYATGVNALSRLDRGDDLLPVFRAGRAEWDAFCDVSDHEVERLAIPYENTTLPGYLFRPAADGPTPLLVAVNGSDGSPTSMWSACAWGGLRRGYAVLVFDGPGQQSMLFEHQMPFRPDWEHVLTPVLDAVLVRDDVDAGRVAVHGISQGGYWVARALAFEGRFAAAVVDPGVVDVATSWTEHLPKGLLRALDDGDTATFDRDLHLGLRLSPQTARTWAFRARPYGTTGYADTMLQVRRYDVTALAGQITTPLLITSPEGEQFWPGQSKQLASLTPAVSTLMEFTAAEGADGHCQPLAPALTEQRVFDWLDERLDR